MMPPHGPGQNALEKATTSRLEPERLGKTKSFMFVTRFPGHLAEFGSHGASLQDDELDCRKSLEKKFDSTPGKK